LEILANDVIGVEVSTVIEVGLRTLVDKVEINGIPSSDSIKTIIGTPMVERPLPCANDQTAIMTEMIAP